MPHWFKHDIYQILVCSISVVWSHTIPIVIHCESSFVAHERSLFKCRFSVQLESIVIAEKQSSGTSSRKSLEKSLE